MAALSFHQLDRRDVDMLLLNELLKRWERCFSTDSPAVEDERLFRSLNMANAATKLPAGADTNLYDVVRSAALWASAFEILYPAKSQAFKGVYAALESITSICRPARTRSTSVRRQERSAPQLAGLAVRRNQFAAE